MQQPPESPAGPPPAPPAPRPATAATASASGSAGAPHGPYAAPFPDGEADVRDLAVRYLAAWTAAPDRLDGGRPAFARAHAPEGLIVYVEAGEDDAFA
ncbi:hypothetical protein AB0R11_02705, partial [Streptomyces fradiae]